MAFYDNKKFLISHIRHSFISCDDTGMCEAVMAGENLTNCDSNNVDDSDLSQSYDIVSDMDIGAHRRRSNTAVRLERLKKERKNQVKTKNVQWSNFFQDYTDEDIGEMFQKKEVKPRIKVPKSVLSEQLASCPSQPSNLFNEYAKFDGNAHSGLPTKKIHIFLTMMTEEQRNYPMEVITLTTARVQDLIGLICWKYVNQKKKPDLKENIERYSLHIAEDDGEVDLDFPCLDPKDNISKFGFSVLALVEKNVTKVIDSSITISVNVMNEGTKKIKLENGSVTVQELLDRTIKTLNGPTRMKSQDYRLEKLNQPGSSLDPNSTLLDLNCVDFSLNRNSNNKIVEESEEWTIKSMTAMEAPLYQSYTVNMFHKLRTKSEVHLGISGEKIELDPVQPKTNKFWNRQQKQKPASYDMDTVAACDLLELRYPDKAVFRLMLQNGDHDFRHHDFEADKQTVENIVEKMSHILEMRSSTARREYLAIQEKKPFRKQFNIGPR